jgi:hypothetical protein
VDAAGILEIPIVCTEQSPEKLGATVKELDIGNTDAMVLSKTKFS